MDAELLELQKQFEAVQHSKSATRLSERNVVELVTKLQQLGLLDSDLLYTLSGKEYLTQDRLKVEMEEEIERLGRVSVIDLAAAIGVDLSHCEKKAQLIVSDNSNLMLVQGEIISTSYWDSVAEEVNESLSELGHISIAELAARLNVSAELIVNASEPRLGKLIHGKLEGGQLYTEAYVARIRAVIRGAIRALMVPTNMSVVWSSVQQQLHDMDESMTGGLSGEGQLFQSIFSSLLKEGAFSGSVRGGGSVWIPDVFAQAQQQGVESFYSQNSYISYENLRKLAIPQPKQFLQSKYPDGIPLETVFVHPSFINVLDAAAEEAIQGGGWVDGLTVVSPAFGAHDVAKLILLCPSLLQAKKESEAIFLAQTCIVSNSLVKNILHRLEAEIREISKSKPKMAVTYETNSTATKATNSEDLKESIEPIDGQRKGGRKKGNHHKSSILEPEEEAVTVKGPKGKKRSGKTKGMGNPSAVESGAVKKGYTRTSSIEDDALSEEQIEARIREWYPDMEMAGSRDDEPGVLTKELTEYVRPLLVASWRSLRQATFTAAAEERRDNAEKLQKKLNEAYSNLQLYRKALDLFDDDQTILALLQKHLLRTSASEIADTILLALDIEKRLEEGEAYESLEIDATHASRNNAQRLALAKKLHGISTEKAIKMVESLDGKTIEAFDSALEELASESGIRLKRLDKKTERPLLHSYRRGLASEIEKETDPISLLPKVVALLFAQVHSRALQAPGRALTSAIAHLKNTIPDAAHKTLLEYHSETVTLLSLMSTASPEGDDCTSDRLQTKRENLEARMPQLKGIVMSLGSEAPEKQLSGYQHLNSI